MSPTVAILLLLTTIGCSTSNGGTTQVMGTFGGSGFRAEDAIAYVDQATKTGTILLTSTPNACADVSANILRQNARFIRIDIFDMAMGDAQVTAGDYLTAYAGMLPPHMSQFRSTGTDGQCTVSHVPPPDGTGNGTVTLRSVNGTTVTGSFDVVMETAEHVIGTFEPSACPELAGRSTAPTCSP
jgi:hypothetical protein